MQTNEQQPEEILAKLKERLALMETFDLLSNISFFNHAYDSHTLKDVNDDQMVVIAEFLALLSFKCGYVVKTSLGVHESKTLLSEIQVLASQYIALHARMNSNHDIQDEFSSKAIASRIRRDESIIRNPSVADHHFMFSKKLYHSFEDEIVAEFGFSVVESIRLRKAVVKLINQQFQLAVDRSLNQGIAMSKEVFLYRSSGNVLDSTLLTLEELVRLNNLSRRQIKEECITICRYEMFYKFGDIYSFSAVELSVLSGIDLGKVAVFLHRFSCTFNDADKVDALVGPVTILKSRPLIENNGRFLVTSISLLEWSVEPVIEDFIKSRPKLQNKFKETKHQFLLENGLALLNQLLASADNTYSNLYYLEDGTDQSRCETDGLIVFDRTIFVVEAKANRLSQSAKEGKVLRTEMHLEQLVKDSYEQGLRTLRYLESSSIVEFFDKRKKSILKVRKGEYDQVILVTLILEPIGNIVPLIRVTNDLGYFKGDVFPWIVSIYDLKIIADHIALPASLLQYIRRRKYCLESRLIYAFEEIDLLAFYLYNRLSLKSLLEETEQAGAVKVVMANFSDAITEYYRQEYNDADGTAQVKLQLQVPGNISRILDSINKSKLPDKYRSAKLIIEIGDHELLDFDTSVTRVKRLHEKDGQLHDCSMEVGIDNKKVIFTYMVESEHSKLERTLLDFSVYKLHKTQADIWVGIGDSQSSTEYFDIRVLHVVDAPAWAHGAFGKPYSNPRGDAV